MRFSYKAQLLGLLALFFLLLKLILVVGLFSIFYRVLPWYVAFPLIGLGGIGLLTLFFFFFWKKGEPIEELIESLQEGVILMDSHLHITLSNQYALNEFSYGEAPYLQLAKEALASQKITRVIQGKKGKIEVSAQKMKNKLGVLLILREQTNEEKADELAHDFIANASHELKTPITIVRGFAETLHEHPELSREVTQEITGRIVDNCERMVSVVKSLLTLATVDEGIREDRLHRCDPYVVVENARNMILAIHPTAEISIKKESSFFMKVDKDLLQQAILNLLDNAVKYSGEKAKVEVTLSKGKDEYLISIRDHGPGIAPENLERIFEKFYAVDKTLSRNLGGYGLGLSIVRRIVEKHHGKIEVQSKEGLGSTFTLHFPILQ